MFKRMYLEITNVCNLRCAFCPGTNRPQRFMTPEEFRQLAARLRPYGTYLMLHVMGEPLLHPQLAELLDIAGALGFRVCLVTNGTLLPRQPFWTFTYLLIAPRSNFSHFLFNIISCFMFSI